MTYRIDRRISSKDTLFGRYTLYKDLNGYSPGLIADTGTTSTNAPHMAGYTAVGSSLTLPALGGSNVHEYRDDVTWVHGRHTMKFGGGFRNEQFPHIPDLLGRGEYVFEGFASGNPVADFLLGNPFESLGAGKRPIAYMSFHYYDWFVQDDWKVAPRLTLNFGMRYERVGEVTDRYRGRLGTFDEATGVVVGPGPAVDQAGLVNPDNIGFQPRFGFSWQPFSSPKTVVRGGYGVYNDVKVLNERNFSLGTELSSTRSTMPGPSSS